MKSIFHSAHKREIKLYELFASKSSDKFNKTFLWFVTSFSLYETFISFKIFISPSTKVSEKTTSSLAVISTVLLSIASIFSILEACVVEKNQNVKTKNNSIFIFFINIYI